MDEMHFPNAEIRSTPELLSELEKSEEGKPCLTKWKTSNHETGTVHVTSPTSIKETCADTLSISPSQRLFTHKEHFLRPRGSEELFLPILRMEELFQ